jgi:bla regulator protein BlaR1
MRTGLFLAMPILAGIVAAPVQAQAVQAAASPPKFEVASIRPCDPSPEGRNGIGKGSMGVTPGNLHVKCVAVMGLIRFAYVRFADAGSRTIFGNDPISGGPSWINSGGYDIEAKASGTPSGQMMQGPMLQALLEDRFNLKIHRETKEIPVYGMTAGKGGFKLQPLPEGSCVRPAPLAKQCGLFGAAANNSPELISVDLWGMSLDQMCEWLSRRTDRPIVNRTGVAGLFTIHLEFANDHSAPAAIAADAPAGAPPDSFAAGPSIFTAVQEQLGLKLEPSKGPGTFLVIDSVERPSAN